MNIGLESLFGRVFPLFVIVVLAVSHHAYNFKLLMGFVFQTSTFGLKLMWELHKELIPIFWLPKRSFSVFWCFRCSIRIFAPSLYSTYLPKIPLSFISCSNSFWRYIATYPTIGGQRYTFYIQPIWNWGTKCPLFIIICDVSYASSRAFVIVLHGGA